MKMDSKMTFPRKTGILAFLAIVLSEPLKAASNIANSSGISDGMLLFLMMLFIALLLGIIQALANSIKSISKPASNQIRTEEKKASSTSTKVVGTLVLLASSAKLSAANEDGGYLSAFVMTDTLFWILSGLIVFLGIVIFILFRSLQTLIKLEKGERFEAEEEKADVFESLHLTDRVPVEEEESIMMDHEYDGIRELDNNLPPWWKYLFYATIVFSVVYIIRYHLTDAGMSSHEEYMAEMEKAVAQKAEMMADEANAITEENVVYLVDAPSIEKGAAIYKGNCATCHGQLGEGGAGPNLADQYWIHGGNIRNVFETIKYGVPAKGMIAWESQFTPQQMQQVASYVLSLRGTDPPNAKAPQGEVYVEEFENEEGDSTKVVVEVDR